MGTSNGWCISTRVKRRVRERRDRENEGGLCVWRVHHDELGVCEAELVQGRCALCECSRCGAIEDEQPEP
jgi:hypothetical protein